MNGDGLLDLVSGDRSTQRIRVYLSRGDGSFEHTTTRTSGGGTWMLVTGDVDGDGDEDVAAVNGEANNGAILLGDGAGGLSAPRLFPLDPFPLATDLGDVDGDGDLDWVTSSFSGDWLLLENDGTGSFSLRRRFPAPEAASCALLADFDGDQDLDLALVDELADEVHIYSESHAGSGRLPQGPRDRPLLSGVRTLRCRRGGLQLERGMRTRVSNVPRTKGRCSDSGPTSTSASLPRRRPPECDVQPGTRPVLQRLRPVRRR